MLKTTNALVLSYVVLGVIWKRPILTFKVEVVLYIIAYDINLLTLINQCVSSYYITATVGYCNPMVPNLAAEPLQRKME